MLTIDDLREFAPYLLQGTAYTLFLALASMTCALVLALGVVLLRLSSRRALRWIAIIYVDFLRGTPLLLQLFYIYYVLPYIGIRLDALEAGIIGLSLNFSAYLSEVYRAAIAAVPKGQTEAATALGMSYPLALRKVILPQALRIALPPIGNHFIAMFKETSLCAVISVQELLFTSQLLASTTFKYIGIYTTAFVMYFAISYPASLLVQAMERRLKRRLPPARVADDKLPSSIPVG